MITNFEIENFKSFAGKQSLKFAPITLIFGPNSSGKSSVIQSLMMLKQTMLSKSDSELVPSGDFINLGTYNSLVHGQNIDNKMFFSIEYDSQYEAEEYRLKHGHEMLFANSDYRTISFSYSPIGHKPTLTNYGFNCRNKQIEKIGFQLTRVRKGSNGETFALDNSDSLKKVLSTRHKISPTDPSWLDLTDSLGKFFRVSRSLNVPVSTARVDSHLVSYTNRVVDDIANVFEQLKYLGPLRSSPKRYYSDEIGNYQKGQGKSNLGNAIFNSTDETKLKLNSFLSDFKIPYEIEAVDLGNINTGQLISIQLKDLRNGATVTPKDVGFGIGQVLPIILEAVISKSKLICVEQPEIHLHPRLQAHLADLFIDSVSESQKNQWIIETHSEALMLRIQRRIREGKIPKELVSVLYVDVGNSGSQVTQIELDDDGDFTTDWPEGFFEERLEEVFGG
jgi:AAA15 family ATPase/GTPase